jgi:hypothetical protein
MCANAEIVPVTTLSSPIEATLRTNSTPLKLKQNPLIVQNLSCPIILGMDTLKKITIGESSVTLQDKVIPTIDPHSSDLLLTGIIEIDKNSGKEKEKYDEFIKGRTQIAQKTNFVPEIGSFGSANPEQKAQLEELVMKYRLSFNMASDDLGRLFEFRYTLPMFDEKQSSHQPPRPIPIHSQAQVEEEISKWKQLDLIEKTQSAVNIPLIILRKSDKTIRISLDARGINSLLVKDRYALPHFTTVFTRIGERLTNGKECFISLVDFFRGYWQVLINEPECHKPPTDKSELKRYLGMVNFNVKFVRKGSHPRKWITWTNIHQQEFEKIEEELLKEPTLVHYKPGSKLVQVTDSSGHAVGGILYQVVDDVFSPLGYFSKSLQGLDLKRPMRIKELFALCWGIQFFEYFLVNTDFDAFVDPKS